MKKYLCPACHEPTISFWQKHTLGPLRKITCARCGTGIGVPIVRGSIFVLLAVVAPFLGGVAAVITVQPASLMLTAGTFVLGMLLPGVWVLWLYERTVPLLVRNA